MRLKKYNLTDDQIKLLDSIEYSSNNEAFLKVQIRNYLTKGYPLKYLKDNFNEILALGRDSSSLHSYVTRYGPELGKKMFQEKTNKSVITKEKFIKMYGESEALQRLSARGASLENYINRHGETVGKEKWQNYLTKRKRSYAQGREENRYASRNLEWFQNKHGISKGYEIWNNKRLSQAYKVSRNYYIELYGVEEGTRLCAASKTRSLDLFIKKYGIEEGKARYNKWLTNIVSNRKGNQNYSRWATQCCNIIKETINDLFYYAENEMIWQLPKEYQILLNQKVISPDLFYRGKIIEFHGDSFHGNPLIFKETDTPHPFNKTITVKELNQIDKIRRTYYESKGYNVLEIWENEFKINKEETIKKCLIFLK